MIKEEPIKQKPLLSQLLFPANLVSLGRLLSVPLLVWSIHDAALVTGVPWVLLGLVVFLSFSDWVDGWLARGCNQVSSLGLALDPLADKVCILGSGLAAALWWGFPWWVLIVLASRDLIIVLGAGSLMKRFGGKPPASRLAGKLTTLSLGVMSILFFLRLTPYWEIVLGVSLSLWVWSCVDYGFMVRRMILDENNNQVT